MTHRCSRCTYPSPTDPCTVCCSGVVAQRIEGVHATAQVPQARLLSRVFPTRQPAPGDGARVGQGPAPGRTKPRRQVHSVASIIAAYQRFAAQYGRPPRARELRKNPDMPHDATVRFHCGSHATALRLAGLGGGTSPPERGG